MVSSLLIKPLFTNKNLTHKGYVFELNRHRPLDNKAAFLCFRPPLPKLTFKKNGDLPPNLVITFFTTISLSQDICFFLFPQPHNKLPRHIESR